MESEPGRLDAVLAMYVAEQHSLPARHEFRVREISDAVAKIAPPRAELKARDLKALARRQLLAEASPGTFTLTADGRRLGERLLHDRPRRREVMADGRVRVRPIRPSLDRYFRLSELLVLDAAQGRRSHWQGKHGIATTDVDVLTPDPAAQQQESALLFRLRPIWNSIERRWRVAWAVVLSALLALEATGVALAFAGSERWAWMLLLGLVMVREASPFRGVRYTARLVRLLNPRFHGPPIHAPGFQPASAFALYLREFRAERNQQLNALNSRWGSDPYERRARRVLERRSLRLLGLVDPSRPEPPQFVHEAVAVADARWEAEVRRLVPASSVILLDLRRHSMSADGMQTSEGVETELEIIDAEGADERTIRLGHRGLDFMLQRRMWHVQPQWLTALDAGVGLLVAVVLLPFPFADGSWATGYVIGRLHVASTAILMAWQHRFRRLLDHALGGDPRGCDRG